MLGGRQRFVRTLCARQLACGVMGGLLVAPWGMGLAELCAADAAPASAAATAPVEGCAAEPPEKSIVVETVKADEDPGFVMASDLSEAEELEPIANVSENEPDLAEPDEHTSLVPTLDEEYAADAKTTADAKPSAESVAADETANDDAIADDEFGVAPEPAVAPIQVASFNGATPGVTTRAELLRTWGQPMSNAASGSKLVYAVDGFSAVTVTLVADRVESLRVELPQPVRPDTLTNKLGLAGVRPAVLSDAAGVALSTAFPERGVTFIHRAVDSSAVATDGDAPTTADADQQVQVIVIRQIEAATFLLRADTTSPWDFTLRIADLEAALRYDAQSAHIRWLLSEAKLATGSAVAAEALAREAVDLEPRNDEYRLQWGRCLKCLARYDQAVEETRLVIEGTTATPIIRARALEQMASLAALGSTEVQKRAVPLHNKAIALADQLSKSDDAAVRVAATQVLVNAHLAVAERVAVGAFDKKKEIVAQWISRASALSEELIGTGEADVSLRLQVALTALIAGAKLDPPIDPQLWIDEAEQAITALHQQVNDEMARNELDWQLGLAYLYATEISHRRADADAALKFGALAESALEPAAQWRKDFPDTEFVIGRLYFQIGAVYAVHRTDHVTACQWYDRAIEPLSQPVPVTELAAPGHHGDALVSMAVSYWETGDRERAYELTGAGIELVEQGIAEGLLAADAIDVPRSNFLAMSRALGKTALEKPSETVQVAETEPAPAKKATPKQTVRNQPQQQVRTATRRNATTSGVRRR